MSRILLAMGLSLCCFSLLRADGPESVAFFEKQIRPVLVDHCYSCHSSGSKSVKGGLKLDTKAGLLAGGDSGPVLVPKKPDESLLLKVLKYDHDIKMPPKGKLKDNVIHNFTAWIAAGAVDPRDGKATSKAGIDLEKGKTWWAYQLPKPQVVPNSNSTWPTSDIDKFLLAKMQPKKLSPNRDAPKPVLLRRLYLDLIGLPPTPEELAAFVKDNDPKAFEKQVEMLLASPRYGERWGRHWLDVVRFGESLTLRGFILKDAWRYRDYVIESFNTDLPYNRFLTEQLAGDLLDADNIHQKQRQHIATTFLALGNTNLEEQDKKQLELDIVDEQLDVITKGFLAQTVTCARCHDHKFDPIPTKDYYALAGILKNCQTVEHANVSKWLELPIPLSPQEETNQTKMEKVVSSLQRELQERKAKLAKGGVLAIKELPGIIVDDSKAKKVGQWKESASVKEYIGEGYVHDDNTGKGNKTITFAPEIPSDGKYEVRFAYTAGDNRSDKVAVTVFGADGEVEKTINQKVRPSLGGHFTSLGVHRFEKSGQSFVIVSNQGSTGHVIADAVQFLPVGADNTPTEKEPIDEKDKGPRLQITQLEEQIKAMKEFTPPRPFRIGVKEEKQITDLAIRIRGNVHNLGAVAPRDVLAVAKHGPAVQFGNKESGRRELAQWIASEHNPLTSRVIVNRVWHWLMGKGLCTSVDNFGTTGETPSHPELLDHLALQFMQEGWSIKKLIRHIVLSHAYQIDSTPSAEQLELDPGNRYLSWHSRKRMEAEVLRDTLLSVSGNLNLTRPKLQGDWQKLDSDYGYNAISDHRSVYLPAFRNSPNALLEAFDMADASVVTGARNVSTVAPQSLFLLNHSFVTNQCRDLSERLLKREEATEKRLEYLYQLLFARNPTDKEVSLAKNFLVDREQDSKRWARLIHALVCTFPFRYVE